MDSSQAFIAIVPQTNIKHSNQISQSTSVHDLIPHLGDPRKSQDPAPPGFPLAPKSLKSTDQTPSRALHLLTSSTSSPPPSSHSHNAPSSDHFPPSSPASPFQANSTPHPPPHPSATAPSASAHGSVRRALRALASWCRRWRVGVLAAWCDGGRRISWVWFPVGRACGRWVRPGWWGRGGSRCWRWRMWRRRSWSGRLLLRWVLSGGSRCALVRRGRRCSRTLGLSLRGFEGYVYERVV